MLNIARGEEVQATENTPHGTKYVVDGSIVTPEDRIVNVRIVWIIEIGKRAASTDDRVSSIASRGEVMIGELDTVVLLRDLEERGLECGDIGAVVHFYEGGEAFEVEFVTGEGDAVAVLTLNQEDVRLMEGREILHARALAA